MQSVKCRNSQVFAATFYLLLIAGCRKAAPPAPPPLAVDTIAARVQTVPVIGSWVATLDGMVDAEIQPRGGSVCLNRFR